MDQFPAPTAMFRAVKYIADHVSADEFQFPVLTVHALRRASREFAVLRPPARLACGQVMREMGGDEAPSDALKMFIDEACAGCCYLRELFLRCAALHGRTLVCQALLDAASRKSASTLKDLMDVDVCNAAARGGHKATLLWAISAGYSLDSRGIPAFSAARGGHAELVEWIFEQPEPEPPAISPRRRRHIADGAANGGHLPLLKWAVERGCDASWTAYHAAMGGHLDVMNWALANGARPLDDWDLSGIASNAGKADDVPTLEWAVAQGAPLSGALHAAFRLGRMRVLQWAHERGFDLSEGSRVAAERLYFNFEVLVFLKARGALRRMACWRSMQYNPTNPDLVEWLLRDEGGDVPKADVMNLAMENGDTDLVRLLHARGFPLDKKEAFSQAIVSHSKNHKRTPEEFLDFLLSAGCVPSNRAMTLAAKRSDMAPVMWLHARGFRVLAGKKHGPMGRFAREWLEANGAFGGHPPKPRG